MWGYKRVFGGDIGEKQVFSACSHNKIPLKLHVIHYETFSKVRKSIFRKIRIFLPIMAQLFGKKKFGLGSTRGV